ncbi:MAG: radical SAM family heme chaperone HemW [Dolichospermum sp.]
MTLTIEPSEIQTAKRLPLNPNYPPFRQWKRGVVAQKLQEDPLCLYIHIPFCTQRCAFCYYKTVDIKERPEIPRYVDALCQEIKMVAQKFNLNKRPIKAVYFGGGTPTVLEENHLVQIVSALRENFHLFAEKIQFSVEAEPLSVSPSKMNVLREIGVNRLSLGIQSFNNEIIKLSGRGHDAKQAYRAIDVAQKSGHGQWSLNIDLLSGLAAETTETWQESLECALKTGVESITIYKMEAFANTEVFQQGVRQETIELPSEELEMHFMQLAMARLEQADYHPWSHFTYTNKQSARSEYTWNIWQGMDFYGFGLSAFGYLGDSLLQNTNDMEKYTSLMTTGELPLARGYKFTSLDRMIREVLLGMKLLRFDLVKFQQKHGFELHSLCNPTLQQLASGGFIKISDTDIELTSQGILYGDYVGETLAASLKHINAKSDEFTCVPA